MEKVLFKLSLYAVLALLLVGAAFVVRVKTGKSFEAVLTEYKWLPGVAFGAFIIVIVGIILMFLVVNNQP